MNYRKEKTEYYFLEGKAKWVRIHQPDPWGNWKMDLYPTDKSLEILRDLQARGIKNVIKKDEDGYYVTLRRPTSKTLRGKVVGFAAPEVLDGSVTLEDGSHPPLRDVSVGNGSDVVAKVEVYHYGDGVRINKGIAMRLASIRVDNLIPFTVRRDFDEDQEKQIRGLEEQPAPIF